MEIVASNYYQKLSRTKIHHVLFWLIYGLFWMYLYSYNSTPLNAFVNAFIFVSRHGAVSYFNMYVLFSSMLKRKQYVYYAISICLSPWHVLLWHLFFQMSVQSTEEASKALIWDRDFFYYQCN